MSGTDSKSAAQRQTRYVAAPNPPWVSLQAICLARTFCSQALLVRCFMAQPGNPSPCTRLSAYNALTVV